MEIDRFMGKLMEDARVVIGSSTTTKVLFRYPGDIANIPLLPRVMRARLHFWRKDRIGNFIVIPVDPIRDLIELAHLIAMRRLHPRTAEQ